MEKPCVCGHAPEEHGPLRAHCAECDCVCYEPDEDYDDGEQEQ